MTIIHIKDGTALTDPVWRFRHMQSIDNCHFQVLSAGVSWPEYHETRLVWPCISICEHFSLLPRGLGTRLMRTVALMPRYGMDLARVTKVAHIP